MNKVLYRFWPILFILGIWFLFSYPYFFQNKVPYPSEYQVNFFPPWSHFPQNWGPVKNNAMPDVIGQIYPWKHFTIETLKSGQIPYWNPNNFGGNPHVGNFQSAVFSPFNILYFILPFIDAWSIVVLLQPLLAGVFTYLYVRKIGVSKTGSVVSSACYMFCGFIVVWMAYGTLSMVASFLPFLLYGIESFVRSKKYLSLIVISLGVPIVFFSGHFQIGIYVFLFSLVYAFFRVLQTKKYKLYIPLTISFLIGVFISLLQLIPSIQLYAAAVRSEIFNSSGGIPFQYLITLIAPDFYGNPVTRNDWVGQYAEWASFVGLTPVFLALFAVCYKRSFYSIFFALSSLIIFLLALDWSLQSFIGSLKIPVISTSNPTRIIVLFSFSVAVLSGLGIDVLKELIKKSQYKKILVVGSFITLFLVGVWLFLLIIKPMASDELSIAMRNLLLPTGIFILTAASIFSIRFIKKEMLRNVILGIILLFVSFESFRFAQKWMPFDSKSKAFMDLPVVSAMQNKRENGRVFGNLGIQAETYYNLPSLEGYDPLYIGRYGEFIRASANGDLLPGERSIVRVPRDGKYTERVLDLLGVSLIFHPNADTNQEWAFPVWRNADKYKKTYEDGTFTLYRNTSALSRATLFYSFEILNNKKEIIKRFFSKEFDFKKTLLLEEEPGISSGKIGTGVAELVSYTPNKIIINVQSSRPALLFLSDTYYPQWKASVNGKPTKIYRADYAFRAVVVPKGESKVEFYFDPF